MFLQNIYSLILKEKFTKSELLSEIISHNNMQIFLTQFSDALSLLYDIISLLNVSIDGKIHKLEKVSHCFLFINYLSEGVIDDLCTHSFCTISAIYSFIASTFRE